MCEKFWTLPSLRFLRGRMFRVFSVVAWRLARLPTLGELMDHLTSGVDDMLFMKRKAFWYGIVIGYLVV